MLLIHHSITNLCYESNDPLLICKKPKNCNYFYTQTENKINFHLNEKDIDYLINEDSYFLSHLHNTQFKNHLLIMLIGKDYMIPEGPFLKLFEEKGTVLKIETTIQDLMYLKEDLKEHVLEYPKKDHDNPVDFWLIPDIE